MDHQDRVYEWVKQQGKLEKRQTGVIYYKCSLCGKEHSGSVRNPKNKFIEAVSTFKKAGGVDIAYHHQHECGPNKFGYWQPIGYEITGVVDDEKAEKEDE